MEFDTLEGKVISDLLTDYALAFLKEKEREEERARNPTTTPAATASRGSTGKAANGHGGGKTYSAVDKLRAAVKIQALYRGFSLRNEWAREDAAILLQSIFRGYKARVLLSSIIEQMIQDGDL